MNKKPRPSLEKCWPSQCTSAGSCLEKPRQNASPSISVWWCRNPDLSETPVIIQANLGLSIGLVLTNMCSILILVSVTMISRQGKKAVRNFGTGFHPEPSHLRLRWALWVRARWWWHQCALLPQARSKVISKSRHPHRRSTSSQLQRLRAPRADPLSSICKHKCAEVHLPRQDNGWTHQEMMSGWWRRLVLTAKYVARNMTSCSEIHFIFSLAPKLDAYRCATGLIWALKVWQLPGLKSHKVSWLALSPKRG